MARFEIRQNVEYCTVIEAASQEEAEEVAQRTDDTEWDSVAVSPVTVEELKED